MIIGVMIGVAVMVAIDLANASASQAFNLSTEAVVGKATHQILGSPQGIPEEVYIDLRRSGLTRFAAPVISEYVTSPRLGGQPFHWPNNRMAFNLVQDIAASRLIFDCGVPLVHISGHGVASHLMTNIHEIEEYVQSRGDIGNYLCEIYRNFWSGRLTQNART